MCPPSLQREEVSTWTPSAGATVVKAAVSELGGDDDDEEEEEVVLVCQWCRGERRLDPEQVEAVIQSMT